MGPSERANRLENENFLIADAKIEMLPSSFSTALSNAVDGVSISVPMLQLLCIHTYVNAFVHIYIPMYFPISDFWALGIKKHSGAFMHPCLFPP